MNSCSMYFKSGSRVLTCGRPADHTGPHDTGWTNQDYVDHVPRDRRTAVAALTSATECDTRDDHRD